MTQQVMTANRLHDGAVVYLGADKEWSRNIESGLVVDSEETDTLTEQAEQAVQAQLIVVPYLINVEVDANSGQAIRPTRFREKIRAKGPTIFAPAAE